jgi:hypothetical protein
MAPMSSTARIYQPAKTAMQSGKGKAHHWVLEFIPTDDAAPDPLMGWTSMRDTMPQVHLQFETAEEAVAYATKKNIVFELVGSNPPVSKPKAYAENYAFVRRKAYAQEN